MKFSELFQTYNSMEIPSFNLSVGGTALESTENAKLLRAVCSLTSRPEAGYLLAELQADPEDAAGKTWLTALRLGAGCSFSLGYDGSNQEVFRGFLYDIGWSEPLGGGPMPVEALFLDARGRLMLASTADAGAARTRSQLVQTIFEGLNCSGLGLSATVKGVPEEWDLPTQRKGLSDYDILRETAEFLSYEFYAWADELYFGPARPDSAAAVEFDGPDGLSLLRRRATLAGQTGGIAVSGTDDAGERIVFTQKRGSGGGYGTDGLSGVLKGRFQLPDPGARTMAQAQYLAQRRMEAVQRRGGGLEGRCLGLPELRPGRFIKTSGMSEQVNGTCYVHTVRHTLDEAGFDTWFEAED